MRNLVISALETITWIVAGLILIGGVVVGGFALAQGQKGGLLVILMAPLYAIMVSGAMLLAVGIYHHTRRTAEALERLEGRAGL